MAIESSRVSNAMGVPLPYWIIRQLDERSFQNGRNFRVNEGAFNDNVLYQGNKTAWVRLVSSVNIGAGPEDNIGLYKEYFKGLGINFASDKSMAEQFVLYAGTSAYRRQPPGSEKFSYTPIDGFPSAYNVINSKELNQFGYRPMPGLSSVKVVTQGRMGSLRSAEIQIRVWDKFQLDIIDALYFKLGFTMFLEWGHTYYYKAESKTLEKTEDLSINPFSDNLTKEKIQYKINRNIVNSEGNYDAMLGMVTNFSFTYNQEGGYDCVLRLQALGLLAESMKMNNPGNLPDLTNATIKQLVNNIVRQDELRRQRESGLNQGPFVNNTATECVSDGTLTAIDKKKNPTAFFDNGILKIVNNKSYYFYSDGTYQTTGFRGSGKYECRNGVLYIDGKNTNELKFTYQEALNSAKQQNKLSEIKGDSLLENYYVIDKQGAYSYLAINKIKNLLPIDSDKSINANIQISNIEKLPSFSSNGISVIDLLTNAISKQGTVNIPLSSTELGSGAGLSYFAPYRLEERILFPNENYKAEIGYDGIDRNIYYLKLEYGFYSTVSNLRQGDYLLYGIKTTDLETRNLDIQDAIKVAIVDPNTQWKLTKVSTSPYTNRNNIAPNTFEAEFTIKVNRTSQKNVVLGTTSAGEDKSGTEAFAYTLAIPIKITFSDLSILNNFQIKDTSDLISPIDAMFQKKEQDAQNIGEIPEAADPQPALSASDVQKSEAMKYQSAFEVLIRTIQLYSLDSAVFSKENPENYNVVSVLDPKTDSAYREKFLKTLFSMGLFSPYIKDLLDVKYDRSKLLDLCKKHDENFNSMSEVELLELRIRFGFHFGLLASKITAQELFTRQFDVDFLELFKTYVVPYKFNTGVIQGTQLNYPVYLELGFVLSIINHICNIYDASQSNSQAVPLVYFDFNPNTNICLSNTSQLSTNPYEILIPFEGTDRDFADIIDPRVVTSNGTKIKAPSIGEGDKKGEETPIFKPIEEDKLSVSIPKFKFTTKEPTGASSAYRGKTMKILVSIDYLLRIVTSYAKQDGSNDVYTKPFIEQILFDINKYLGDFNMFRLAYDDNANSFHVADDQMTPNLEDNYIMAGSTTISTSGKSENNKSQLPLFGKNTIAKSIDFRTEISSKMANLLAISANSKIENLSSLSKTADSFGLYSIPYYDRYIPYRVEIPYTSSNDTMVNSAAQFNNSIKTFYSDTTPSENSISHATNYYIQRMSKIKSQDKATRASAIIPLSLNFSTDGISGLAMGQAFTIDKDYLPYSYDLANKDFYGNKEDALNTVGFVVVGLDQTIDNNVWNSNVRANMIYLKKSQDFNGKTVREDKRSASAFSTTKTDDTSIDEYEPFSDYTNVPGSKDQKYSNIIFSISRLGNTQAEVGKLNQQLLSDINSAAIQAGVVVSITTGISGHKSSTASGNKSRHTQGNAVDIAVIDGIAVRPNASNREKINKFVSLLQSNGYAYNKESGNKKAVLTFDFPNHDNHVHVSYNPNIA